MDKNLDKILDSYIVADADEALLERVLLCVQEQQALLMISRKYLYAGLFSVLAFFGFWMGNVSMALASAQTVLQYKYVTQTIVGPISLSDFLL